MRAIRPFVRLFGIDSSLAGFHHLAVVGADTVGDLGRAGGVIGLARHVRRVGIAAVLGVGFVAANVNRVAVLPEDPLRNVVEDGPEHLP